MFLKNISKNMETMESRSARKKSKMLRKSGEQIDTIRISMISFEAGKIIRHRETGRPLLVLQVLPESVLVSDPTQLGSPVTIQAILERDVDRWCQDTDMECIKVRVVEELNYITTFKYSPLKNGHAI